MKAPFTLMGGALIAVGLLAAVAVVVMGEPLLGFDLGAAVTLLVGGCLLWALGNAINLLRLTRTELRRLRKAEMPPWLREPAESGPSQTAAAASAEAAAAEAVRQDVGERPMVAAEAQWPETAADQTPEPEPAERPEPEPEPEVAEPPQPQPTETPAPASVEREIASALHDLETASEPAGEAQAPPGEEPIEPPRPEPPAPEPEPAEAPAEAAPAPQPAEPALPKLAAELDETDEAAEAAAEDGVELYVVEERMFRGKPARVLSDGTIEAETDEGWMRFEDFDHLREYMDAMAAMHAGR